MLVSFFLCKKPTLTELALESLHQSSRDKATQGNLRIHSIRPFTSMVDGRFEIGYKFGTYKKSPDWILMCGNINFKKLSWKWIGYEFIHIHILYDIRIILTAKKLMSNRIGRSDTCKCSNLCLCTSVHKMEYVIPPLTWTKYSMVDSIGLPPFMFE